MVRLRLGLGGAVLTVGLFVGCDDQPLRPEGSDGAYAAEPSSSVDDGNGQRSKTLCGITEQIFVPRCAACHLEGGVWPDLTLDFVADIVNAPSQLYAGATLVVPGDPAASLLLRKLTGTQSTDEGGDMPVGAPLSEAEIRQVTRWIEAGASTTCEPAPGGAEDDASRSDEGTSDERSPPVDAGVGDEARTDGGEG